MSRAVRFDHYGEVEVLEVVDVERPKPGANELLVQVRAAAINPGEVSIREGRMHERWPATFPSGQGSDLAGTVLEIGDGVEGFAVGQEVLGFTHNRASHAELVLARADQIVPKPANVPWEAAGSLGIAGTTAYAAVRAVALTEGDTVVVSGAAGGVGSLAVQLARLAGASVIGLAGEANHRWLSEHHVIPVSYRDGVAERVDAASGGSVDAFIDTFGDGYVELALALGIQPQRIDTIIDFQAAQEHGVKAEGSMVASNAQVLTELAGLIDAGKLEVPIARVYPLEQVQDAFRELEQRHTRGKIVLTP